MTKNLPKIFVNPINQNFTNTQNVYYSDRQIKFDSNESVKSKIDRIFSGKDFVYKSTVWILTNEGIFDKTIIGRTNSSLLTIDNESISIDKIKDIKKKNT